MNDNNLVELLPEYVNGRLDDQRRANVDKAVVDNKEIRNEIAFLKILRDEIKKEKIESSPNWGWRQLEKNIEAHEAHLNSYDIEKEQNTFSHRHSVWRNWAVAASLVVVIQSAYLVSNSRQFDSSAYVPLSSEHLENVIDIRFVDGASETEIRQLLLDTGGKIVGGPSALGIYQLEYGNRSIALKELKANALIDYAAAAGEG